MAFKLRKFMQIYSVRYGFATNSSSSHSIVIGCEQMFDTDVDGDFGWNNFVAASPEAKLRWLAAHFNGYGNDLFKEDEVADLKKELFGFTDDQIIQYKDDYVDHQSNFYLGNFIIDDDFKDFMADFKSYIIQPNITVYGGNDNDDNDFGPTHLPKFDKLSTDMGSNVKMVVKKEGDFYSIFNAETGFKIRLSFSDNPVWEKARSPELVDLKISDYCPYGCTFCYQGSTKDGKHAPLDRIKSIIDSLAETKVFEVAIGGGEPTEHPDFIEILEYCTSKNIVPNFTTFSTKWLNDDEMVKAVTTHCKGIGVSVHNAKSVDKVKKIKDVIHAQRYDVAIMAQHVIGTASSSDLHAVVDACITNHTQLLLLGFKKTGFGEQGPEFDIEPKELGTIIQLMRGEAKNNYMWFNKNNPRTYVPVSLSIDTQIISLYKEVLEECSINPVLLSSPEGKFSCYWDAVDNRIAKSSYCDQDEYYDVKEATTDEFKLIFSRF